MTRRVCAGVLLAALIFAAELSAHDTWLLPQSMRTPVGRPVTLSLTSGEAFPADDFAIDPTRITRATVRLAGRTTPLTSPNAAAQALRYHWTPRAEGLAGFAIELAPKTLLLAPEKIEEYFAEINASKAMRAAWDSVPMPRQWRESYTKHATSFVSVGDTRGDTTWRQPLGTSFEIAPEVDPASLHAGQVFAVRVVHHGAGVPQVEVGVQREGEAHASFSTTDKTGRARIRIPRAGRWLVNVTSLRRSHVPGLEWQSDFATLTIAVAP